LITTWCRRVAQLALVTVGLLSQTACLEHFEELVTTVSYDPFAQTFRVQRWFRNVEPAFFGCIELDDCAEAITRATSLQPAPFPEALSDRLVQRLVESGAEDIEVELVQRGAQLDARIAYTAAVGSAAAEDTMVHAEWDGKRNAYYLVVDADASMELEGVKGRERRVAMSGPGGIDWRTSYVLKPRHKEVTTRMAVDDKVRPLFEAVGGLDGRLADMGLLDTVLSGPIAVASAEPEPEPEPAPEPEVTAPAPSSSPPAAATDPAMTAPTPEPDPDPEPEPVAAPEPSPPSPAPTPEPVAVPRSRSWPAPDPQSPARTYSYDARVTGGGLSVAAANVSVEPLLPRVQVCYQERQAVVPELGGSAFLSALVKADGSILSTSVYGSVDDRALLDCLEQAIEGWSFQAWGAGEGVSDVALPLVFRVEEPQGRGKKKKKKKRR